ncbi:hypothetical protein [Mesorhizobium sp. M7A.F.Ca.CA.004.05.2.1]|uniref:hypothetical protein n=1 Tax=Mesorhizobium sp. M7A.F.Ca.CA.004.05.2.1 TaxID=2496716 RepID=UPI001FE0E401|nr:hypothetical protein [Mesorhizobium sp. M7A.F.Ca.CA.004.05.2.1]
MAISPPSDIVMDVARAADPADIETARAALAKRAGGAAGTFSLDTAASVDAGSILSRATADKAAAATDPANKFKKFEAMVLQTFIRTCCQRTPRASTARAWLATCGNRSLPSGWPT